jgi:hypothetical protein
MRRGVVVIAVLAVLAAASPAAAREFRPDCEPPYPQFCGGVSADGSRVVFGFAEPLAGGPERPQVYERSGGVTRALVPYPENPPKPTYAALLGTSEDARHVFVWTNLTLSPADLDGGGGDVYDIFEGTDSLVSTGPTDPQAGPPVVPASFVSASRDGARVFLAAWPGGLVPEDADGCPDLYEWAAGVTRLVSTGPTAAQSYPPSNCDLVRYGGLSGDGTHVYFGTGDRLIAGDEGGEDIYQRVGDELAVLTTYPEGANGCVDRPEFGDASADGRTVLFSTAVPIGAGDLDTAFDVYLRAPDGSYALVSAGTDGGSGPCGFGGDRPVALSADGRIAIFETAARLSPADTDAFLDLYAAEAGTMTLLTTGPTDPQQEEKPMFAQDWDPDVSDDGRAVAFESRQRLVAEDDDDALDVYLRTPAGTELASTGPVGGNGPQRADLIGLAGDGGQVVFATEQRLTAQDTDDERDFYLRSAGSVGEAGASAVSRPGRKPGAGGSRTVLISAESVPPRMAIARRARRVGDHALAVRVGCPKTEASGPCRGRVGVGRRARGPALGVARFRIAAGRRALVRVRLRRGATPPRRPYLRVRGADRLGNAATVGRRVLVAGG